jgi:hypothetical protein
MIIVLIIIAALFFIGAIFYKQSVQEYRINQIDWEQRHELDGLLEEKVPVVIRGIPAAPVWTHGDVMMRDFYGTEIPPGSKQPLRDLLLNGALPAEGSIKWPRTYRRHLYHNCALELWFEGTWAPILGGTRGFITSQIPVEGECFAGDQGLMEAKASWTLIAPTEGAIIVNILAAKEKKWLPPRWQDMQPSKMTAATAPYISQMKYMDIIVRPGTGLWIPTHWLVSWTAKDEGTVPLVATLQLHNPISWLATRGT